MCLKALEGGRHLPKWKVNLEILRNRPDNILSEYGESRIFMKPNQPEEKRVAHLLALQPELRGCALA